MGAPFTIVNPATDQVVYNADALGNTQQAGISTQAGLVLTPNASPSAPAPGSLVLYSPDGKNLFTTAGGGAAAVPVTPAPAGPVPATGGLLAWDYDPVAAATNTTITTGVVYFQRISVAAMTATNVVCSIATGGGTLTAGQNFAGIYDQSGNRLAVTTDQTTPWGSAGAKIMPLTAQLAMPAGTYYIAVLSNGTTSPAFHAVFGATATNAGITAAPFRFSQTAAAGNTTLPATSTTTGWTVVNSPIWTALS